MQQSSATTLVGPRFTEVCSRPLTVVVSHLALSSNHPYEELERVCWNTWCQLDCRILLISLSKASEYVCVCVEQPPNVFNSWRGWWSWYILNWVVSMQFSLYLNSYGQIESSTGKEGVDYFKKTWEHVWLMGNNQVLNSTQWICGKMANFEKSPSKLELFWSG